MSIQSHRLVNAGAVLSWPIGMTLASWRYIWRTTPVYRRDHSVDRVADPPTIPDELCDDLLRRQTDGVGPMVNRLYGTEICGSEMTAEDLIGRIVEDPNRMAPREVAYFRKTHGDAGSLQVGDEYLILMPGPWNGPVRVLDRAPCSFRFATLTGHMEAGQIEFRARDRNHHIAFEIESWATSGDQLSSFLYNGLGLAKELQLNMWTHFLERVVRTSRGRMAGGIHVTTYRGRDA